jgi:hypothetical protein
MRSGSERAGSSTGTTMIVLEGREASLWIRPRIARYELGGHFEGPDGLRRERSRIPLELCPARLQFPEIPGEPLLVDGPVRTAKDS